MMDRSWIVKVSSLTYDEAVALANATSAGNAEAYVVIDNEQWTDEEIDEAVCEVVS